MKKQPEGITYITGWEDSECASIHQLICSCGTNLLSRYEDFTASNEETIECPNCKAKYQFIWMGMILRKVSRR